MPRGVMHILTLVLQCMLSKALSKDWFNHGHMSPIYIHRFSDRLTV